MSLKAKIEAVIYASEEPVTLAQLIGLLGVEAQSELDAQEEHQRSLALIPAETSPEPEAGDADALDAETVGETDAEPRTQPDGAPSEPDADEEETSSVAETEPAAEAPEANAGTDETPEEAV